MRKDSVLKIIKDSKTPLTDVDIQYKYDTKFNVKSEDIYLNTILDDLVAEKLIDYNQFDEEYYYIKPETKLIKTNKSELIKILKNNIGKLLTIKFKKEDGTERICNGQFTNHLTELGYYHFKEKGQNIKQFDAKNLLEVRVNNTIYLRK